MGLTPALTAGILTLYYPIIQAGEYLKRPKWFSTQASTKYLFAVDFIWRLKWSRRTDDAF